MRANHNLTKAKNPKAWNNQDRAQRAAKRLESKEDRTLEQLRDLVEGIGWSSDRILARYFAVSRQRIWVWSKEGKLPAPRKHGEATTRWLNSEVREAEKTNFLRGN